MKQSSTSNNPIPPGTLAVLLTIFAIFCFGIGGMLLYCGIHPFGSSPPPPLVCWIAGMVLVLLGIGLAFGAYSYGSLPKQKEASLGSSGRSQAIHGTTARTPATPRNLPASEGPELGATKLNLRDAMVNQPSLQQAMGGLIEALIEAAPEHYSMIHLLIEARQANRKTSILFTHGTPVLLDEYSTLVPDNIGNAAFRLMDLLFRQDAGFPGLEVALRKTAAAKWDADFHRLDEPVDQRPSLPRYPIRVCGCGFSLAPPAKAVFRWARNLNPSAVIAAAAKSAAGPFKSVQVTFTESGPRVQLRDGVMKAEEVIQISEGPQTAQWMIETPAFHAIWPDGFDLRYPLASKARFDLLDADDTLIFVQGPIPSEGILDGIAAGGQMEIGKGKTPSGYEWIELGYEVDGTRWRQRHYARPNSTSTAFVVTAQCLEPLAERVFRSSSQFTDSLIEWAK